MLGDILGSNAGDARIEVLDLFLELRAAIEGLRVDPLTPPFMASI